VTASELPSRVPGSVVIFNAAYIIGAGALALARGNSEFLFYIAIMVILALGVGLIHRRVRFTYAVLWCLSVWGAAHMAGGLVPVPAGWPVNGDMHVLYSLWLIPGMLKYDHVVHAYGFFVATWASYQALCAIGGAAIKPKLGVYVLVICAGMGLGAMNEVVEFIAVLLMPRTNVGGYMNTGWDLVSNLIGCVAAAVALRLHIIR
jgi:hypothetical protein